MSNYSGFYGYGISSVYPNMGNGVTQTLDTTPEPDEQQAYTQVNSDAPQPGVDPKAKTNMGILFLGMFLLIALFAKG